MNAEHRRQTREALERLSRRFGKKEEVLTRVRQTGPLPAGVAAVEELTFAAEVEKPGVWAAWALALAGAVRAGYVESIEITRDRPPAGLPEARIAVVFLAELAELDRREASLLAFWASLGLGEPWIDDPLDRTNYLLNELERTRGAKEQSPPPVGASPKPEPQERERGPHRRGDDVVAGRDERAERDAHMGALELPGSYGLCWRDLPAGGKCERDPHEGPCAPFALLPVEPIGRRQAPAFVDYAPTAEEPEGRGALEILSLPVYPPSLWGERLREARTGICAEALGAFSLSVDAETGTVAVGASPVWCKLGGPLVYEGEGRRLEVTAEQLQAAVENFQGEVPVDDGRREGDALFPSLCLGRIGRVEMRGVELWGLVMWAPGAKPVPLSYAIEMAPKPRLLWACPRRFDLRAGDLVSWSGVDMTIAGFEGERKGDRIAVCSVDGELPAEVRISERRLTRREDRRFLGLGEAARLAGMGTAEFSGLERGSYTLAGPAALEEWERLIALVDQARRAKPNREGPRGP